MSGKPTIEARMRALATKVRHTDPTHSVIVEYDAIRIAREYAAERTAPLVAALEGVNWSEAMTFEGNLEAHVYLSVDALNAIRAALAAEQEARQ